VACLPSAKASLAGQGGVLIDFKKNAAEAAFRKMFDRNVQCLDGSVHFDGLVNSGCCHVTEILLKKSE